MKCNIDRRGRTARFVVGVCVEAAGMALLAWWFLGGPGWTIWPAACSIVGGNFAIIEGTLGWCAVRAMGFRTPI